MKMRRFLIILALLTLPLLQAQLIEPLFDVSVEIPTGYQIVQAGDDLLVSIKLVNVGSPGRIDVYLDHSIKDEQGKILLTKLETVAVETQANFVRSFYLPPHTRPGAYTVETKLVYFNGQQAISRATFQVEENPMVKNPTASQNVYQNLFYVLASLLVLDLLILVTIKYVWPILKRKSHPKHFYTKKK